MRFFCNMPQELMRALQLSKLEKLGKMGTRTSARVWITVSQNNKLKNHTERNLDCINYY